MINDCPINDDVIVLDGLNVNQATVLGRILSIEE
jgi:hypothetical protein